MNWKPITEIPKHKTRQILVVNWHNDEAINEYIADDYRDLQIYMEINNFDLTHWTYIKPPSIKEVLEGIDEAFFYSCECGYEGEDYECAKGYCPSCDKPIEVNLKPHLIAAPSCKSAVGKNKNGQ